MKLYASYARTLRSVSRIRSLISVFSLVVLVGVATAQTPQEMQQVQELFSSGNVLLNNGDVQGAVDKYNEAIKIAPTVGVLFLNRGMAYVSLQKFDEAYDDADRAFKLLSNEQSPAQHFAFVYQIRGFVYQARKDYPAALEAFAEAIARSPQPSKLHNARANVYRLTRETDKAITEYTKAIESEPNFAMFHANRGGAYLDLKKIDAAMSDVNEAIRLDSNSDLAYYTRGRIHMAEKRYDEAEADVVKAISIARKFEYMHARGIINVRRGNNELAVESFSEAIRISPNSAIAFSDRAIAYSNLDKLDLAVADIRRAIFLKEDSGGSYSNLAFLLYRQGKYNEAIAEATTAIRLAPKWSMPYKIRSSAYAKLKNRAKALADAAMAKQLGDGVQPRDVEFAFDLKIFVDSEDEEEIEP